jgi:hypothetical protein
MQYPTVNYAQQYGQLGQQVAGLGAAIDETTAWAQLQQRLRNFGQLKQDFAAETIQNLGNKWTPQQQKRFRRELEMISDPSQFMEMAKEFEEQMLYYDQTGQAGSAPSWGHKADWYKARKGEEQATEFLGQAMAPRVTQPQSVGGVPAQPPPAEGQLPIPPRAEKIIPGGLQRPTPEGFGREALEELRPEALADPRIAAAQKTLAAEEQTFQTRRQETIKRMDEQFDQSMKRITTGTGIDWRVGGHTAIFETKDAQTQNKERMSALEKLGRDLGSTNERKIQEAEMDAANLGVRADRAEIAREIALGEEKGKRYDDYIEQIKNAMKLKEKAEKEKRLAKRQPKAPTPSAPDVSEKRAFDGTKSDLSTVFPKDIDIVKDPLTGLETYKVRPDSNIGRLWADLEKRNALAWLYRPKAASSAGVEQPPEDVMEAVRQEVESLRGGAAGTEEYANEQEARAARKGAGDIVRLRGIGKVRLK